MKLMSATSTTGRGVRTRSQPGLSALCGISKQSSLNKHKTTLIIMAVLAGLFRRNMFVGMAVRMSVGMARNVVRHGTTNISRISAEEMSLEMSLETAVEMSLEMAVRIS